MNFGDFIARLFEALDQAGVEFCVLRNHEALPGSNTGRDIDILVEASNLGSAISCIASINGTDITDYVRRSTVTSLFIDGVTQPTGSRAIEIDFLTSLTWKGLPYISSTAVLREKQVETRGSVTIPFPAPPHEAVISLFSSYLVGGWIKERYQAAVRHSFKTYAADLTCLLAPKIGSNLAAELVATVSGNSNDRLMSLRRRIVRGLAIRSFAGNPAAALWSLLRHYWSEAVIRHSPRYIRDVCFLGPDGAGKSTIIAEVSARLQDTTKQVEVHHLKPAIRPQAAGAGAVTDPHEKSPRSAIVSVGKIMSWVIAYHLFRFRNPARFCVVRLWDRYFHDLLIDPRRYRFGAPRWTANLISIFVPEPRLWIVLDAPAEQIQQRKSEVAHDETVRQRRSYCDFAESRGNAIIVDTQDGIDAAATMVRTLVIERMAADVRQRLGT